MTQPDVERTGTIPDSLLARVLEAYLAEVEAGRRPDQEALLAANPEIAERLRTCFDSLRFVAQAAEDLSSPSGRPAPHGLGGTLGDFRILREIGRGGMGIVYEAEQISLGRRVALKVLPFASVLDERQLTRFKNEARAAAALKHPNIVGVYSVGCERGVHYYAMEYIEGQTLAQVIGQLRNPAGSEASTPVGRVFPNPTRSMTEGLPIEQALEISGGEGGAVGRPHHNEVGRPHHNDVAQSPVSTEGSHRTREFFRRAANLGIQAAEALEHAHQTGVVHRDVKPSNLMVDVSGDLWVTDFGLAMTQADRQLTITGDLIGTLRYMSPEQLEGDRRVLDHHTDIYSLGVTLYELLTLQPAVTSTDRHEVIHQIAEQDPPPPRQLNRAIPADLETIVLKAMAKEPSQRYAAAQEMAGDLKRFLADEPIRARRPSLADRAAKWARRHRPLVWSAVVLLVFGTMGSLISTLLIASAYDEKNQQLTATEKAEQLAREQEGLAKQQEDAAKKQAALAREQQRLAHEQKEEALEQRDISEGNLYVAHMRLAPRDWEQGLIGRLREMLDSHIPQPGRPDLRGWEWYYYFSLCHKELMSLGGDTWMASEMESIAWSPDGKRLASADEQGTIQIRSAATGREILKFSTGKLGLGSVAWSPNGERLATGGGDSTASIWDAATGKEIFTFHGFNAWVRSVAWSPDGRHLVAGDWGGNPGKPEPNTVKVWDATKGQEIVDLKGKAMHPVAWSPDGKRLATGKENGKVPNFQILDAFTGRELRRFSSLDGGDGFAHNGGGLSALPGVPMESGWPRVSLNGCGSGRQTRGGSC